jgi:hypothetical protein
MKSDGFLREICFIYDNDAVAAVVLTELYMCLILFDATYYELYIALSKIYLPTESSMLSEQLAMTLFWKPCSRFPLTDGAPFLGTKVYGIDAIMSFLGLKF